MTEYFEKNLFEHISMEEYKKLLPCLNARNRSFLPGETLCRYDSTLHQLGIMGTGTASVVRYEYNGARTILERLGPQDLFGQLIGYGSCVQTGVSVVCETPCEALFLEYSKISAPCTKACAYHHQLTQNLLTLVSSHALSLSRRVEVLSQRTIREKLLCYFNQMACQAKSPSFQLPFTMVDLADYLSIDRSAMTRELKRMREDHRIALDKRQVQLLE